MGEKREGVPFEQALKKLWLKDSRGPIVKNRSKGGITEHKAPFAHEHAEIDELGDCVKALKPTVLIGAAGVPRVFTEEIIKDMASFNEVPITFALSNPTSMAECTAEEAYTHTDGRALFASGSPFPDFQGFGKTYKPGQGNNAYIFPGASLAVIAAGIHHISDGVFLSAAEALADMVSEEELAEEAYEQNTASTYPEPEDKEAFIRTHLYDYNYDKVSYLPSVYPWPAEVQQPKNPDLKMK